jgi:ribosomal protein L7Ae-like RNA K-turn-binding protein
MKEKILNLLGLATRARMITLGEDFVLKKMQESNAIVFLASDAGNNIKKKINDKAKTYNITVVSDFSTDEISQAMGKTNRKVVLVQDKGFVKKFTEYINS